MWRRSSSSRERKRRCALHEYYASCRTHEAQTPWHQRSRFPDLSISRINALFPSPRVSPRSRMAVNLPSSPVPEWNRPARTGESLIGRRVYPVVSSHQASRDPAASIDVAARAVGCVMSQSNKPACDGARQGGNGNASTEACFLSRWVRIFSIITGSSMQVITFTGPPHSP